MAPDEKVLEELYELLGLYFRIDLGNWMISSGKHKQTEPQLDRVIFREKVLARITTLIMTTFISNSCNSKGED